MHRVKEIQEGTAVKPNGHSVLKKTIGTTENPPNRSALAKFYCVV